MKGRGEEGGDEGEEDVPGTRGQPLGLSSLDLRASVTVPDVQQGVGGGVLVCRAWANVIVVFFAKFTPGL